MNIDELEKWANENYRLSRMTTKGERERQDNIKVTYLHWLVQESSIFPIHTYTQSFNQVITREQLESNNPQRDLYDIYEVLTYCVDIEPDNIPVFVSNTANDNTGFLKTYKIQQQGQIAIPESMFMFHDINEVYVILVDKPVKKASIMKTKRSLGAAHKTTKRVSFREHT